VIVGGRGARVISSKGGGEGPFVWLPRREGGRDGGAEGAV
jgi:hypothetical protein